MFPATLRRGHVHDQAPVEGLERQKRSDQRIVAASHVKDVAAENGSTTSRHAERNDIVDALSSLQRIGVIRSVATRDERLTRSPTVIWISVNAVRLVQLSLPVFGRHGPPPGPGRHPRAVILVA